MNIWYSSLQESFVNSIYVNKYTVIAGACYVQPSEYSQSSYSQKLNVKKQIYLTVTKEILFLCSPFNMNDHLSPFKFSSLTWQRAFSHL